MVAWFVAAIGVIAGALAGYGATSWHPAWLTSDIAATAGLVSAICVGLAALLPQLNRTPKQREDKYIAAATVGQLPKDIAEKHPTISARLPR